MIANRIVTIQCRALFAIVAIVVGWHEVWLAVTPKERSLGCFNGIVVFVNDDTILAAFDDLRAEPRRVAELGDIFQRRRVHWRHE